MRKITKSHQVLVGEAEEIDLAEPFPITEHSPFVLDTKSLNFT